MRAEYEIDVAGCRTINTIDWFSVRGMLINISLIIRAFVECGRFEWAIYLIKRSVAIRYDSFDTRECCVRQAWQIENDGFLSNVTQPKFCPPSRFRLGIYLCAFEIIFLRCSTKDRPQIPYLLFIEKSFFSSSSSPALAASEKSKNL